ncbi:MAG: type II toxin-antitoxin system VapC family toxin [Anaerolineae bacterium]
MPIELTHILRLADLPHHHGDPFDRLIIAQAMSLDLPIITHDPMFASYEVQTMW